LKYLQVYVTASSLYTVQTFIPADTSGWTGHTAVTPIVQNTLTGYSVQGAALSGLDTYPLASQQGILAGTDIRAYGNILVGGTVDGRDVATDGTKLDGIETGATADQTAVQLLAAIKTVDGAGSGLDADLLDGVSSSSFLRSDASDTVAGPFAIGYSAPTTTAYGVQSNSVSASPFSGMAWHDLLAFDRNYSTAYETFNGSSWSASAVNKGVFAQKENQTITLASGSGTTKVRYNFTGTAWSQAEWLCIGFTYTNPASSKTVILESSSDNTNWTTRHTSTTSSNATMAFFRVGAYDGDNYLRLTFERNDTNDLKVSFVSLLTKRSGDQGRGKEQEFPYAWDADKNITVENNLSVTGTVTAGDVNITGPSPFLTLTDNDVANEYTSIQNASGGTYIDSRNGTANGLIAFRGRGNNILDEYARFDENGNFGIGTPYPDTKLHIDGGSLLVDAYNVGEDAGIFLREGFLTIDQPSITVWDKDNGGASPDGISINGNDGIRFRENGGEVARFDDGNFGIGNTSPATALDVTGTVTATAFAGDGSALTGIAAGAGGGGSDEIFWENGQNVTSNYTITNGKNAMSAGPITINSGVTVTVGAGETWTVI
tara:strand:- start:15 stop:1820 length:1806 start_codon:yes stop_codon:yes gene_type:complete